jgi:hypothetical protein
MTRTTSAVSISVLCLATLATLYAQSVDATLKGRVTDSSDAAMPGVKVEARNTGTNVASSMVTDSAGQYTIPLLKPGSYTLTVEAPGFKKFTREGLSLSVGDTVELDVKLQVGGVSEQLTVTGEASLLETA